MKLVWKVLGKTLDRFNLRSNPIANFCATTSMPKVQVNSSIQVNLAQEEDNCKLIVAELPFCTSPRDDVPQDNTTQ